MQFTREVFNCALIFRGSNYLFNEKWDLNTFKSVGLDAFNRKPIMFQKSLNPSPFGVK